LREARKAWKKIKIEGDKIRKQFPTEHVEDYAARHNISSEYALKSIKDAEESRKSYHEIKLITEHKKDKSSLTGIKVDNPHTN
jgi:hypothetical protein